jgi:hypothetical protein
VTGGGQELRELVTNDVNLQEALSEVYELGMFLLEEMLGELHSAHAHARQGLPPTIVLEYLWTCLLQD